MTAERTMESAQKEKYSCRQKEVHSADLNEEMVAKFLSRLRNLEKDAFSNLKICVNGHSSCSKLLRIS